MVAWEYLSIRKTLEDLRKNNSGFHWLVLRSAHLDGFCECINEVPKQYSKATSSCKRCLGSGRVFTDHLIKGLQYIPVPRLSSKETQSGPGIIHNESFRYCVTTKNIIPKEIDFIIEVDLNKNTGDVVTPVKIRKVYDISNVRTLWGDKGREEWYSLTVESKQIAPGTFSKSKKDF